MSGRNSETKGRTLRAKIGAWVGLLAFALNLATGLFLSPPAMASTGAPLPSLDQIANGERFVICTAGGLVVLDQNGDPVSPERPDGSHQRICALCLPINQGGMAQIETIPYLAKLNSAVRLRLFSSRDDRGTMERLVRENGPRAPPHPHS